MKLAKNIQLCIHKSISHIFYYLLKSEANILKINLPYTEFYKVALY